MKHISVFKQKLSVDGYNWEIEGNFLAYEYDIYHNGNTIATISKEWFTFGDAYSIDVADGVDPVSVICVVLIIDAIRAQANNNGLKFSLRL